MKKSDIATITLVISMVGFFAWFLTDAVLSTPDKSRQTIITAEKMSATVPKPDHAVFNNKGINPTVEYNIGSIGGGLPFDIKSKKSGD